MCVSAYTPSRQVPMARVEAEVATERVRVDEECLRQREGTQVFGWESHLFIDAMFDWMPNPFLPHKERAGTIHSLPTSEQPAACGTSVFTCSGAEAPPLRAGGSAVSFRARYATAVLRPLRSRGTTGGTAPSHRAMRGSPAASDAGVPEPADAAAAAPAAGVRSCRAPVIGPDAAAWSFRASGKPLPSGMG